MGRKLKTKTRQATRDISRAVVAKLYNLHIRSPYSHKWVKVGSFMTKQKAIDHARAKYPLRQGKVFNPIGKVVWTS